MGKRRADADTRRFFDEFERVKVSRLRALGIVDPTKPEALIPWPSGKVKLLGVRHNRLRNGGGWSFFVCPGCARRTSALYNVDDRPLCTRCCAALNIHHRSTMGFGREERRRAANEKLDALIAKLETTAPLRVKTPPTTKGWHGRAQLVYNSRRLTLSMRRRMITLRLDQIARQATRDTQGGLRLTKAYRPTPQALAAIPELQAVWKARTYETLARALDAAQTAIIKALDSNDPNVRVIAARIMLKSKQGDARLNPQFRS